MTGFQPTSLINCVSALIKCSADLLVSRNRQCDPDLYGCVQKPGTDLCEGWSREERSWNFRKLQLDLFQMLGHFRILMNSKCVLTFCGQRSPLAIRTFFSPKYFVSTPSDIQHLSKELLLTYMLSIGKAKFLYSFFK